MAFGHLNKGNYVANFGGGSWLRQFLRTTEAAEPQHSILGPFGIVKIAKNPTADPRSEWDAGLAPRKLATGCRILSPSASCWPGKKRMPKGAGSQR